MISMEDLLKWSQEDVSRFKGMCKSDHQIVGDEILIKDPISEEGDGGSGHGDEQGLPGLRMARRLDSQP